MLDTQYRMHPVIASLPNWPFYDSKLVNRVTAEQRASAHNFFTTLPLSFLHHEQHESEIMAEERPGVNPKKNYFNLAEIFIIQYFLKQMAI